MTLQLRQIALVARELEPVLDDLTAILGINRCFVDPGVGVFGLENTLCLLYTSPSPRDATLSRMPSSA